MKMTRALLLLSFFAFDALLYDLLWDGRWFSRSTDEVLVVCTGLIWLSCVYVLLRALRLPREGKIACWLVVLLFSGYMVSRVFSRYAIWSGKPLAQWFEVELVLLLFVASLLLLAKLLLPERKPRASAPYTVESETPDHVLHVDAAPLHGEHDRTT